MGKHAQPRQSSRARRAAVVSTGTLLLCLGTAAPALADIGPVPVPQPIEDTVEQVSDATGLPNPIDAVNDATGNTDTAKTPKHGKHNKHHVRTPLPTSRFSTQTNTSTDRHTVRRHHTHHATAAVPASYTYGGLRGVAMSTTSPLVDAGRAPVTAGALTGNSAVLAAGSSPTLVTPAADMLDGTGGEGGPRVLLVGLAAMVLGGLCAGHIKVAQDRLAQIIA